jgi:hypothetical protein
MGGGGHDGLATGLADALHDLLAIGGDHDAIGHAECGHALENSDDDGDARERPEGFSGETRRAQSGWDDGERLHAERGRDATFTPRKVGEAALKR